MAKSLIERDEKTKLKEISKKLFYEIDMLNISAVKVNNAVRGKTIAMDKNDKEKIWKYQVDLNFYLESFSIHARNLIEFLKAKITKKYVRAEHFLDKEKNLELKKIMIKNSRLVTYILEKSNKQVVHLTFDRIESKFQGSNKSWDMKKIELFNEILKHFLESVKEELICDELIELKKHKNIHRYYISRYIEH